MATILTKKRDTAGAPAVGDLTNAAGGAELAVNTLDKRLYTKSAAGAVVEIGTNPTIITVDNIQIDGNTISSTNTNGDISLTPNGTGEVNITKVDIDSGAIDGVTIGTNSVVTDLRVDNIQIDGNTISSTNGNGNIVLTPNGTGDVQLDADTVRVGDSGNDATIASNGNADLIIQTGNAATGSIRLYDGTNGNIAITPNGTGEVDITKVDIDAGSVTGLSEFGVFVADGGAKAQIGTNAWDQFANSFDGGVVAHGRWDWSDSVPVALSTKVITSGAAWRVLLIGTFYSTYGGGGADGGNYGMIIEVKSTSPTVGIGYGQIVTVQRNASTGVLEIITTTAAPAGYTTAMFMGTVIIQSYRGMLMGTRSATLRGNLAFTSGAGIDFSDTTDAGGMTSEVLSDYEEGTWTPVISDGTNNATMSANNKGAYTKVGRQVTVTAQVETTSLGSVSGAIRITGLPYSSGNDASRCASATVGYGELLNITAGQSVGIFMNGNVSYLALYLWDSAAGVTTLQGSEFSADGVIAIQLTYFT